MKKFEPVKRVLFVCVENSNRSQMAEAFASGAAHNNSSRRFAAQLLRFPSSKMVSSMLSLLKEINSKSWPA